MKKQFYFIRILLTTLLSTVFVTKISSNTSVVFIASHISFTHEITASLNEDYNLYFILDKRYLGSYHRLIEKKSNGMQVVDDIDDYNFVKAAIEKLNINKIDYVIAGPSEESIMLTSKLRQDFNVDNGIREETAKLFVNKLEMKKALRKHNIAQVPFTDDIEKAEKFFGSHIVLKPKEESGSRGIKITNNKKEFNNAIGVIKSNGGEATYIAEKHVDGEDYMINCIISDGDIIFSLALKFIGKKIDFYQKGEARGVITVNEEEKKKLVSIAKNVMESFNVEDGGFFIDFIKAKKTGELLVSEVACRLGGGKEYHSIIKKTYGFSMCEEAFKAKLGIPLDFSNISKESISNKVLGAVKFTCPKSKELNDTYGKPSREINEISSETFSDNLQTFSRYHFEDENKLPEKGTYLGYYDCIFIFLESENRETLLNDIKYAKKNFVLKFNYINYLPCYRQTVAFRLPKTNEPNVTCEKPIHKINKIKSDTFCSQVISEDKENENKLPEKGTCLGYYDYLSILLESENRETLLNYSMLSLFMFLPLLLYLVSYRQESTNSYDYTSKS